jgi:polyferredoxin
VASGRLLTSPSVWLWVLAMALALASIRWLRVSYGVFAVAVLLAVPLTGAFGASLRYAVVAWPIFVLVGKWLGDGPRLTAVASVLALGLAFCGLLFVHGYWVS